MSRNDVQLICYFQTFSQKGTSVESGKLEIFILRRISAMSQLVNLVRGALPSQIGDGAIADIIDPQHSLFRL